MTGKSGNSYFGGYFISTSSLHEANNDAAARAIVINVIFFIAVYYSIVSDTLFFLYGYCVVLEIEGDAVCTSLGDLPFVVGIACIEHEVGCSYTCR